jgi:CHAT domain-containing protein
MTTLALRLIACSVAAAFLSPAGEPVAPSRHRTIDARIVGERYRPLGPVRRDIEARAQAAELVLKWRATPQLSRWAYSALELGRELELVSTAQALLEKGPDYEVLVALSAAYSHIASQGNDVVAAARAFDAAKRGTLVAPDRPEAWFNLAVAEQLGLSEWDNPWRAYARVDAHSEWANEASRRAVATDARLVSTSAQTAVRSSGASGEARRSLIEHELVPAWANLVLQQDPAGASAKLTRARSIAESLAADFDDSFLTQYVDEIGATGPVERVALAEGVVAADRARRLRESGSPREACAGLRAVEQALSAYAVARRLLVLQTGACLYYAGDYASARTQLSELIRSAGEGRYSSLGGRASFVLAATEVRDANAGAADRLYRQAREWLELAGEVSYLSSALAISARQLHEQGDDASAWELIGEAFRLLPGVTGTVHQHAVLSTAIRMALDGRFDGLALHLSAGLQRVAKDSNNPGVLTDVLTERVRLLASLGQLVESAAVLREAREAAAAVTDPDVRVVADAGLDDAAAQLLKTTSPCEAADAFQRSLQKVLRRLNQRRASTYRDLADALERCGQHQQAASAYRLGIEALEATLSTQNAGGRRILHTAKDWDLYWRLARVQASHLSQVEDALVTVDRGRTAFLGRPASVPVSGSLSQLRSALGSNAVLTYVVLENESFVWATTAQSVQFRRIPAGADRLQTLVDRWLAAVRAGSSATGPGHELYQLLVEPVADSTTGPVTAVIPDGPLHSIAFGALWTGNAYLVERTALWTATSLESVVRPLRRPMSSERPARALVVGNPFLAQGGTDTLPSLRHAEAEAREVADAYPTSRMLIGTQATKAAVLQGFSSADVVHIAAHAVVDLSRPFESRIPLAGADGTSIGIDALLELGGGAPRVIVLASCRSATGKPSRGYGATSLARVLVQDAVPAAIGALWDIDDAQAPALARELHRRLAAGDPVVSALRESQLSLLRRGDEHSAPRLWAALVGIGESTATVVDRIDRHTN